MCIVVLSNTGLSHAEVMVFSGFQARIIGIHFETLGKVLIYTVDTFYFFFKKDNIFLFMEIDPFS